MEELKKMVKNIKGSYDDFVDSTLRIAEIGDNFDKIKNFIETNPDITSSDVVRFMFDNCEVPNNNDEIPEWAQENDDGEE